jgi:hydroxypyruvate isomerase
MNQLKLSFAEWSFFKPEMYGAEEFYQKAKEMGYTAVEMTAPERLGAAAKAGVKVINQSGPGMQKGANRVEHHVQFLKECEVAIKAAAKNKIKSVIVFSGNREKQDDREGLGNCIVAFKHLAKIAQNEGVGLLFEMLNSFDHGDYQANQSWYGFELVRSVNSPSLKVLYDIYHMQRMGEELKDTIIKNLEIIGHFHIAGSPKRDYPLDGGAIDYGSIVRAVHQAGYRGYWGMEFCGSTDPLADLQRVFGEFQAYAQ